MTGVLIKGGPLGTHVHTRPCEGSCPAAPRQGALSSWDRSCPQGSLGLHSHEMTDFHCGSDSRGAGHTGCLLQQPRRTHTLPQSLSRQSHGLCHFLSPIPSPHCIPSPGSAHPATAQSSSPYRPRRPKPQVQLCKIIHSNCLVKGKRSVNSGQKYSQNDIHSFHFWPLRSVRS